jgi:hypothetical protein
VVRDAHKRTLAIAFERNHVFKADITVILLVSFFYLNDFIFVPLTYNACAFLDLAKCLTRKRLPLNKKVVVIEQSDIIFSLEPRMLFLPLVTE